jgi:hypothetical protein
MINHRRRVATGLVASALTALVLTGGTAAWAEDNSQPQPVYPDQPPATVTPQAQPEAAPAAKNGSPAPAETAVPPEPEGKTQPFTPSAVPSSAKPPTTGPETEASEKSDLQSLSKDPKQWPTAAKNYASTRYSELNEVNTQNVGKLQMAWQFSLGTNKGQEGAPLIVDNTLYVMGPYPNDVFALDATTGDLKWSYAPKPDPAAQGVACCDVVSRGIAYDSGKIFIATLDDHVVALDARTGQELWHTKLGEISKGETITMAPLAAK